MVKDYNLFLPKGKNLNISGIEKAKFYYKFYDKRLINRLDNECDWCYFNK